MYVIVGANGYLGAYLVREILDGTDAPILALDMQDQSYYADARVSYKKCDVTDQSQVQGLNRLLKPHGPVKIFYLAAYHNPDAVKANPRLAWNINITSLSFFLNSIEHVDCLFYPSTEMVYGEAGADNRITEDAALRPVNLYGRQKVAAEALVTAYGYNVTRLPFMIGPSLCPGRPHFYDTIVKTIQGGDSMGMFQDQIKTALDFGTVAGLMVRLAEHAHSIPSILNIAGDEALSKYEIGVRIAMSHGCDPSLIVPILQAKDSGEIFTEKRAFATLLDNRRLKEVLGLAHIKINL